MFNAFLRLAWCSFISSWIPVLLSFVSTSTITSFFIVYTWAWTRSLTVEINSRVGEMSWVRACVARLPSREKWRQRKKKLTSDWPIEEREGGPSLIVENSKKARQERHKQVAWSVGTAGCVDSSGDSGNVVWAKDIEIEFVQHTLNRVKDRWPSSLGMGQQLCKHSLKDWTAPSQSWADYA